MSCNLQIMNHICIYMFICIHMHISPYIRIHTYIHTYIYVCIDIHHTPEYSSIIIYCVFAHRQASSPKHPAVAPTALLKVGPPRIAYLQTQAETRIITSNIMCKADQPLQSLECFCFILVVGLRVAHLNYFGMQFEHGNLAHLVVPSPFCLPSFHAGM